MSDQNTYPPTVVPWPPILLALLSVAALTLHVVIPIPWPGLDDTPARVAGGALCLSGVGLIIWAIRTLRVHNTTMMPHKAANTLVTSGPFAFRRNPIYLGDFLILLGICILTTNLWFGFAALAFLPLVAWLAILPEERHLEQRFGDAWRDYAEKTRRIL